MVVYRGNVDAIYHHSSAARQRQAESSFTTAPFLDVLGQFSITSTPDWLATGDFDADGHVDVIAAARSGQTLQLLSGDGQGHFPHARTVEVGGAITAFAVGEMDQADGLEDVMLGVSSAAGAQVLIYAGPEGAVQSAPQAIEVGGPVTSLALGQIDPHGAQDLVIASGQELLFVPGRWQHDDTAPTVSRRTFSSAITAVAVGNFDGKGNSEVAVLLSSGQVQVVGSKGAAAEQFANWAVRSGTKASSGANSQMLRAKVSSKPGDDLIVFGSATAQLQVVMNGEATSATRALTGKPVAVLPMRLNGDGLDDLVMLYEGQGAPIVALTDPVNIFVVTNTGDSGPGTLRQAISDANASPGADAIYFDIGGGGIIPRLDPLSSLPFITETVEIDGTTSPSVTIQLIGFSTGAGGNGLVLGGGANVVRGVLFFEWKDDGIEVASANNVIEGNTCATSTGAAVHIANVANNTVGGTVALARNTIILNKVGVWIAGSGATGNKVLGNRIGTDAMGTADRGNLQDGVLISGAKNNGIGGTTAGARNLISGNDGWIWHPYSGQWSIRQPGTGQLHRHKCPGQSRPPQQYRWHLHRRRAQQPHWRLCN